MAVYWRGDITLYPARMSFHMQSARGVRLTDPRIQRASAYVPGTRGITARRKSTNRSAYE